MQLFLEFIWLIPIYPLLAFLLIIFFLNPNKQASAGASIAAMALATVHSWAIVFWMVGGYFADPHHGIHVDGWRMQFGWLKTGYDIFEMGFAVDGFTAMMLFMVPFVCLLIFIYASEYMEGYEAQFGRYSRFFAYVSLFAAAMLLLVIADNLLLLFISWEIMGLCSYLLIGFWFEKSYIDEGEVATPRNPIQAVTAWQFAGPDKIPPKLAALKAFITTRIGDVLLFAGMMLLWSQAGTLTFRELFEPQMLEFLSEQTIWGAPVAVVSGLLIFGGAVGKSAQFPLHVWLPDAMEGPTPVSALIHAATMVSAGVYLVARMLPLLATFEGGVVLQWVAIIGAITALLGAMIGVAQYDVKRVLAYSTISQLGYMMMALGIGGFVAGIFHLLTHAFFKALLFMGSGSIIHAMEHGAHHVHDHQTDPQDMRHMGGLREKMPASFWAYLFGTLALVGIFPFAGFWSKDEILDEAFLHADEPLSLMVLICGGIAAAFTAFYMGRQMGLVFGGKPRSDLAAHAVEPGRRMTWPLVVLAAFALLLGLANIPQNIGGNAFLHGFAGEVHLFTEAAAPGIAFASVPFVPAVALTSTLLGLLIFASSWWLYARVEKASAPDLIEQIPLVGPVIFAVLYNKFYFDEIYRGLFIYPTMWLATISAKIDYKWIINPIVNLVGMITQALAYVLGFFDRVGIDGLVNGVGKLMRGTGGQLRLLQTGRAQNYLLILVVGLLILASIYLAITAIAGAGGVVSVQ